MGKYAHMDDKWTLADEELYIDHVIRDHGKTMHSCKGQIDARTILDSWLQNYRLRKWDFKGASILKRKVQDALDSLKVVNV